MTTLTITNLSRRLHLVQNRIDQEAANRSIPEPRRNFSEYRETAQSIAEAFHYIRLYKLEEAAKRTLNAEVCLLSAQERPIWGLVLRGFTTQHFTINNRRY